MHRLHPPSIGEALVAAGTCGVLAASSAWRPTPIGFAALALACLIMIAAALAAPADPTR
jgi:hypothetical protein